MVILTLHTGRLVFLRNLAFRSPLDTPTKKVKVWKPQLSHHHLGGEPGSNFQGARKPDFPSKKRPEIWGGSVSFLKNVMYIYIYIQNIFRERNIYIYTQLFNLHSCPTFKLSGDCTLE